MRPTASWSTSAAKSESGRTGVKIKTDGITGVPETMLYTFYMKYLESIRPDGIIRDPEYGELIGRIVHDFGSFSRYPAESPLLFSCRSLVFDAAVKDHISRKPDSAVVSFGSGLDFRFQRVDNGRIRWFDVDLPEVAKIRRELYGGSGRLETIAASALDFSWADRVGPAGDVFFLAEGLFIYFTRDEVERLLLFLLEKYPGSMLIFDGCTTFYMDAVGRMTAGGFFERMHSMWKWSIDGGYQIENISPRISVENEFCPIGMYGGRMPAAMKDLFSSPDIPGYVKNQLEGMIRVYLVGLGSRGHGDAEGDDVLESIIDAIFDI